MRDLIATIISRDLLERDDLIMLIGGVALHYTRTDYALNKLFSLMFDYPQLQEGVSPVYIIADSIFAPVLSSFLQWATTYKNPKTEHMGWLKTLLPQALSWAITQHNLKALVNMHEYGNHITPEEASQLLWQAAAASKNKAIIDFLLAIGADPNYAQDGSTILMQAIKNYQVSTVDQIVKAGADVNKVVSDAVGTALRLVVMLEHDLLIKNAKGVYKTQIDQLVAIEGYLRNHGAVEVVNTGELSV